jgi:hypothetical protein
MAKGARKSRKSPPLGTLKEFSEALKSKLSTVSGWTKHPTWKWSKRAPWPSDIVPEVLRWAAESLEKGRPAKPSGSTQQLRDEKLKQEIRKLRANADQAETALAKERGALHDADQCEEEATRRATLIRNGLQNVAPQSVSLALSHGMPHEAAPQFQKQIEELVNGCLRHLSTANTQSDDSDD